MTETTLDPFFKACGATGSLRLGVEGPDTPGLDLRLVSQPFIVIGRDPDADLRLDHPEVSRRHAYLQLIGGRLFCMDLQSRSGTRWRDGVRPMGWVQPGQPVGIGPYWIWFEGDSGARESGLVPGDESPPLLGPTVETNLELTGPSMAMASWRIRRSIVLIGRTRPCWVRLPDQTLSRIHCSLVCTEMGFWVVDLLGRGGIAVNGRPARWSRLDPEDELGIGDYRVRLRTRADAGRQVRTLALPSTTLPTIGQDVLTLQPTPRPATVATRIDPVDPSLLPLFQEIGQMQQQMAEQFQQALMMMFQLFSTMHQDQMGLIREELGEIRRLTQEQQSLQAKLAVQSPPPASKNGAAAGNPAARPTPGAGPIASSSAGTTQPKPHATAPKPNRAATPPPDQAEVGSMAREDLHAFLTQRLAAIQDERQSRWQRLLDTVMGKNSTEPKP